MLNKDRVVRMKQVEHTNNEHLMLGAVQHPFIINLWGAFQDSANLYMVMDFVPGGELFSLLRRSNVRESTSYPLPMLIASRSDSLIPSQNSTPQKWRLLSTTCTPSISYTAT